VGQVRWENYEKNKLRIERSECISKITNKDIAIQPSLVDRI